MSRLVSLVVLTMIVTACSDAGISSERATSDGANGLDGYRSSVSAEGRISIAWEEGDRLAPSIQGSEMVIPSLTGDSLEVTVPNDMSVNVNSDFSARTVWLASDRGVDQWRSIRHGWGFMAATVGGESVSLVDWAELDATVIALYEWQPLVPWSPSEETPSHFTLWQSEVGDMYSFSYTSLEAAVEAAQWFRVTDQPGGTLVDAEGLEVVDEAVYVRITPDDMVAACDQSAWVEIKPLGDGHFPEASASGAGGDFIRIGSGWADGFVYRSDSAEATFEGYDCRGPAPAPFLEERLEDLLADLRISWSD